MAYCKQCGTQLNPDSKFCPSCGTPVTEAKSAPRAQIVDDPTDIAVLVNKYWALPADYVPPDLVDAPHSMNQQKSSGQRFACHQPDPCPPY